MLMDVNIVLMKKLIMHFIILVHFFKISVCEHMLAGIQCDGKVHLA